MFDHLLPDRIWLTSTTSSSADLFVLIPDHISPISAYRKGDVRCYLYQIQIKNPPKSFEEILINLLEQTCLRNLLDKANTICYLIGTIDIWRSRTVHVIEEGPREQRNQLFSVLGSLTDPEEEESKESSEILNYQEEEVCKWSSVSTHAEREELNGLTTVWLMNMALSLSSVVDVLSIISWSRILVIVEYDFRKETSKDSTGAGAGGRVIGVSARGGEAAGGEVAGGGDAGWGEAGASGGETVEAGTHGLCGGCGGGATGLITGATFGAAGGETVGVTAGGGVVRDAGGRVAETGGTTVVGGVA
ncbi:unnamed protein product [Brassica napus]|uniref:(rape) hypothetical protein n=1 Tax=Brassica napus TaxID=3708 RepID=A0A816L1A0_BRANA|nr:unnamed protein product [Brassica napus]